MPGLCLVPPYLLSYCDFHLKKYQYFGNLQHKTFVRCLPNNFFIIFIISIVINAIIAAMVIYAVIFSFIEVFFQLR